MGSERKDNLIRHRGPAERRAHRRAAWRTAALLALVFVVLTLLDPWLARAVFFEDRRPLQNSDLDRMLRVVGSEWLWLVLMWIARLHDRVWDRAGSLLLGPIIAGLSAEALKLAVARERPTVDFITIRTDGYAFRGPMSGFADATNLGFPSSHAAVAFAGCLILAAWMPRARWVFFALAVGCGVGRMLIGAHYATDIFVGALIGWGCARFFEPVGLKRRYG